MTAGTIRMPCIFILKKEKRICNRFSFFRMVFSLFRIFVLPLFAFYSAAPGSGVPSCPLRCTRISFCRTWPSSSHIHTMSLPPHAAPLNTFPLPSFLLRSYLQNFSLLLFLMPRFSLLLFRMPRVSLPLFLILHSTRLIVPRIDHFNLP